MTVRVALPMIKSGDWLRYSSDNVKVANCTQNEKTKILGLLKKGNLNAK